MDYDIEVVLSTYADGKEEERLSTSDVGPIEQARMQELIQRFLPKRKSIVYDVGGAAGAYSFWMAANGHEVHLVDVVPLHIEQARRRAGERGSPKLASYTVADGRKTGAPSSVADVILMHGPLYHLTDRVERIKAIREANRILKPGGLLLAVGITRYATLFWGLLAGATFKEGFLDMVREELTTSQHRRPPGADFGGFRTAFFHDPKELMDEVIEGGFRVRDTLGVIGPAWMAKDFSTNWQVPAHREILMEIARLTEAEPALGPRTMVVGEKV